MKIFLSLWIIKFFFEDEETKFEPGFQEDVTKYEPENEDEVPDYQVEMHDEHTPKQKKEFEDGEDSEYETDQEDMLNIRSNN